MPREARGVRRVSLGPGLGLCLSLCLDQMNPTFHYGNMDFHEARLIAQRGSKALDRQHVIYAFMLRPWLPSLSRRRRPSRHWA
ncbi:uncharacterized protein K489DRAFT_379428 [Dissoconium aciculare CBS 342.82]|uniref:Uncharacterized protein n=1 Tax=Dissoconium aciculare CBS 342.82 TaxID=1314786 RepID=A0A6J3M9D9_9PEZI|nr:uncharacterized protein K489DRAFT_379428 [Dissoconium aciculare CBS 342.82]KAF1823427.1 hypothetical protein K489DRAFT_379428 [Dissoconium aciculare CBS 342.82]